MTSVKVIVDATIKVIKIKSNKTASRHTLFSPQIFFLHENFIHVFLQNTNYILQNIYILALNIHILKYKCTENNIKYCIIPKLQ